MNLLEILATQLRHSRWLNNYNGLWNFVRPIYNTLISVVGKNGLKRKINGSDTILVLPEFRGVPEVYEPDVWHHIMGNIKVGDLFVDVGAYIGLYALTLNCNWDS
ncbi:hypothetical protein NWP21_18185 [Anabaenopsis sp. FSS-46]|uniref:hypothetical protein n=1 Tax=Anabaenopsis sp. FSS-46 TaxID=2971766 RepID=UPI002472F16A|nr:hypothetical protein [Anabaenopsis sp. FSS-46]MDH6100729.1 hypothetical protein [Anabaenopsis sp. FSS-46]